MVTIDIVNILVGRNPWSEGLPKAGFDTGVAILQSPLLRGDIGVCYWVVTYEKHTPAYGHPSEEGLYKSTIAKSVAM